MERLYEIKRENTFLSEIHRLKNREKELLDIIKIYKEKEQEMKEQIQELKSKISK